VRIELFAFHYAQDHKANKPGIANRLRRTTAINDNFCLSLNCKTKACCRYTFLSLLYIALFQH